MPTIRDVSPPCDGAEMMDDQILSCPSLWGCGPYVDWSVESAEEIKKSKNVITNIGDINEQAA